jgi:hypothetical protein
MAEADLLIPMGTETFTAASENETLYGGEVLDLGLGVHLVLLIGTFTAMDFGTPPAWVSYGLDMSYDGVLWKADWDWRSQIQGVMGNVGVPDGGTFTHTLPETVRNGGVVTRYVRLKMDMATVGGSFTVKSSLVVSGGAVL